MAKKAAKPDDVEEIELNTDETDEIEEVEPPVEPKPKKKPINIMDPKDSSEPPKRKAKDEAPAVDLSPVLDAITGLAATLTPKKEPAPKKDEPKADKFKEDFLAPLGDW